MNANIHGNAFHIGKYLTKVINRVINNTSILAKNAKIAKNDVKKGLRLLHTAPLGNVSLEIRHHR